MRLSKEEKKELGRKTWFNMEKGEYGQLDRKEVICLLLYAGWKHPDAAAMTMVKKQQYGYFKRGSDHTFSGKEIYKYVQKKMNAMPLLGSSIGIEVKIPLEREVSEFYARIAKKKDMTLKALLTTLINDRARKEIKMVKEEVERQVKGIREKMYDEVDMDFLEG